MTNQLQSIDSKIEALQNRHANLDLDFKSLFNDLTIYKELLDNISERPHNKSKVSNIYTVNELEWTEFKQALEKVIRQSRLTRLYAAVFFIVLFILGTTFFFLVL